MSIIRNFVNVIFLPIYYLTAERFIVTGISMEPTFTDGSSVFVSKIYYRLNKIKFNDVVVVSNHKNVRIDIKRIIGMPLDKLSISKTSLLINGNQLIDLKFLNTIGKEDYESNLELDKEEYFVLGDNHIHSSDSRHYGPVNKKQIIGKVL